MNITELNNALYITFNRADNSRKINGAGFTGRPVCRSGQDLVDLNPARGNTLYRNGKSNHIPPISRTISQTDIEAYQKQYTDYRNNVNAHNTVLASYVDQAAIQAVKDTGTKTNKTRGQILTDSLDNMSKDLNALKGSSVVVINGIKPAQYKFLSQENYAQIKNIYLDILDRPELFNRIAFDGEDQQLESVITDDDIEHKTGDLKHILENILPEILETKTIVSDDPVNLLKILSDEIVQELIIEKLDDEPCKHEDHHCDHHHEDENDEAVERFNSAFKLLEDINNKFNITVASKSSPDNSANTTSAGYYDEKLFGFKKELKNQYETKFLNRTARNVPDYEPENTIIVTPKSAAKDIVEKVKYLNKDYLFVEDWLYEYCLGDKQAKYKILDKLDISKSDESKSKFKSVSDEIDDYLQGFIKVYDTNNPENNAKLTSLMSDFGRTNAMSEISKGYFLGIGEDARELVKMLLSIGLVVEVAEKASDEFGISFLENVANGIASCTDSMTSACSNYLHWKKELGDKAAKENFQNTVTNILTFALPTLSFRLSPEDSPINHLLFRNLSAVDAYSGTISSLGEYSEKLKDLMQKGIKNPPDEIKDDPGKIALWQATETWNAFNAHALNRGQALGIIISQPFALAAHPLMQAFGTTGIRPALIALAGTLECCVSSVYLLLDNANWTRFSNNLKQSLANRDNTKLSPQEFQQLRKSTLSKIIESNAGQAGLSASIQMSNHIPEKAKSAVKDGYGIITDVVNKTVGKYISSALMVYLDAKYNNMSEEELEHSGHHHH